MSDQESPKCGGKLHGRDGTCGLPAGWGTEHKGFGRCRKHFGNSPNVAKAAEKQRLEHEVRDLLARLDVTPVEDPLTELQKLAGEVVAWKNAMAAKVNELTSVRYETLYGEQLRSEVALFERAMDRCERVLTAMARLNIDARLARISEEQGRLVTEALRGALAELGLSQEAQMAARPVVARHLQLAVERQRRALAPVPG
jgi:hypothetical protein